MPTGEPHDANAAVTEGSFMGVGSLRLHTRAWEVAQPRCAVMVVHGHGEHAGRYADFAQRMAAAHCSTYAFDLRGHGRSEGRRGHAREFDHLLQDVDRFRREVEATAPAGTPLFLLGQSMGGLIALRYAQEFQPPLAGLVLVAPWLATAMPVPRWKTLIAPLLARLAPSLPMHTRLDPNLLSRDPAVVRAYREDRYVHDVITPRMFAGIASAMGLAFQRADRLRVPLLLLLGDSDQVVDSRRSATLARALPGDVSLQVFPGMRHEPLNESERARVVAELLTWLQRGLAPKFHQ